MDQIIWGCFVTWEMDWYIERLREERRKIGNIPGEKYSWVKVFLGKIFLGKNILGKKYSWEKYSWEKIFLGKTYIL